MDSHEIITIILTIVVTGIVAPFSKTIFDKIFSAYNPDPKKINSGIKKSFVFIFRYILPVVNLVYLYMTHQAVDKYLVLITACLFSVLSINFVYDILIKFIKKQYILFDTILKINKETQNIKDEKVFEAINKISDAIVALKQNSNQQ